MTIIESPPDSLTVEYTVTVENDDPATIAVAKKLKELDLQKITFTGVAENGKRYEIEIDSEDML